jgi:hypothetical protein
VISCSSRTDGSLLWQDTASGQKVGTAIFGGLSWGLDQVCQR